MHPARYVPGIGNPAAEIVLVGTNPWTTEMAKRRPFAGPTGNMLWQIFKRQGLSPGQFYMTNIVKCAKKDPGKKVINHCRPLLDAELDSLPNKKLIIAFGKEAKEALVPEENRSILERTGYKYWSERYQCEILLCIHPSYVMRNQKAYGTLEQSLKRVTEDRKNLEVPDYRLIETKVEFLEMLDQYAGQHVAADLETTGLDYFTVKVLSAGFYTSTDKVVNIVSGKLFYQIPKDILVEKLNKIKLIWHNGTYDTKVLRATLGDWVNNTDDTMLMCYSLNETYSEGEDEGYGLGRLSSLYLNAPNYKKESESLLSGRKKFETLPKDVLDRRLAGDAFYTYKLWEKWENEVPEFYHKLLMPGARMLADMEYTGVSIDLEMVANLYKEYDEKIVQHLAKIREIVVQELGSDMFLHIDKNWQSQFEKTWAKANEYDNQLEKYQKTLTDLPENELEWNDNDVSRFKEQESELTKTLRNFKTTFKKHYKHFIPFAAESQAVYWAFANTPKMAPDHYNPNSSVQNIVIFQKYLNKRLDSVDEETLEKFSGRPLVEETLQYRGRQKEQSTYLKNIKLGPDGRVHPEYKLHRTVTGRLACKRPNMQNYPKYLRRIYKPHDWKGHDTILSADGKQLEFFVGMAIANLQEFIEKLNAGMDMHTITMHLMADFMGIPFEQVDRRDAKEINFGCMFGMEDKTLAKKLKCSIPKAQEFKERYFGLWLRFGDAVREQAYTQGQVKTDFGRTRHFLYVSEELKQEIGNQAVNFKVQSTAFDLVLEAMIEMYWVLKYRWDADIIINVHDEITISCNSKDVPEITAYVKSVFEKERSWTNLIFRMDVEEHSNWAMKKTKKEI